MRRLAIDKLPDWFSLSRYDGVEKLDLLGWHLNLFVRAALFNLPDESRAQNREWFDRYIGGDENLIRHPKVRDNDNIETDIERFNDLNTGRSGLYQATVKSLPVLYGASLIAAVNSSAPEAYDDPILTDLLLSASEYLLDDLSTDGGVDRNPDIDEFLDTPLDAAERRWETMPTVPHLHIQVHMGAPDSLILKDFKNWLSAARAEFNMPARNMFTRAKTTSWADNRVLQYIDLETWAKFEGVDITQELMGETIFPDAVRLDPDNPKEPASRIRKTVSKIAKELMNPNTVAAIFAQCNSQGHFYTE